MCTVWPLILLPDGELQRWRLVLPQARSAKKPRWGEGTGVRKSGDGVGGKRMGEMERI